MGCGGSTAKQAVDEPLAGVMPGGGSAPAGAGSVRGGAAAGLPAAVAAPPAQQPKKKLVLYDPLTSPFPPSSASLQRKVAGRAPLLHLEPYAPEWQRIPDVLRAAQQRKLGIPASEDQEEQAEQEEEEEENKEAGAAADDSAAAAATAAASVPAPSVFSSSTHEDNVVAGPLGDAHVVAALVSLAAHPNRLARLFRALDPEPTGTDSADAPASGLAGKNTHIGGLVVGSHLPSSSVAKVTLAESGPRFAASAASGVYELRLFYGGLWQHFSVDDAIPVTTADGSGVAQPLFSCSRDGSEYWMMLVEKAMARACGSYEDLCLQTPAQLFRMLTGGSAETMILPRPHAAAALAAGAPTGADGGAGAEECDKLWTQLLACWARSDLLTATTRELSSSQHAAVASSKTLRATRAATAHGADESAQHYFLHDHSELGIGAFYSVLDVQHLPASVGGARLILLRNPAGSQHFDGRWSEGSAEWKALEAAGENGDGSMHAARLRVTRKKHHHALRDGKQQQAQQTQTSNGIFWLDWDDLLAHFSAIFICSVLADQFDVCQTVMGRWEGKSAAGSPPESVVPGSGSGAAAGPASCSSTGVFVHNPSFRIRNTSAKRSTPMVLTLSKGAGMCAAAMAAPPSAAAAAAAAAAGHARGRSNAHDQQAHSSRRGAGSSAASSDGTSGPATPGPPAGVYFGFQIVSNQLNHTLNCNPPTSSPLFGQVQVSPLHDVLDSTKLSSDNAVSLTLPSLPPYVDHYLVAYTAHAGVEGDFVLNLWTNSTTILLDRCDPLPNNPLELPVSWRRSQRTAGGNIWMETYLHNPMFRVMSSAPAPLKLLFNLVNTGGDNNSSNNSGSNDLNLNVRLLENVAPNALNTTAIGCVSAPAKPGALVAAAAGKKGSAEDATAADAGTASVTFAAVPASGVAASKKSSKAALQPVRGSLSPFHQGVDGACTRTGETSFYSTARSYALIGERLEPGHEYFLIASHFLASVEADALLQVYGAGVEHVHVERVGRGVERSLHGRWAGVNAAGPARRKKTYLNNPQFCVRHQGSGPISIVVSVQFLGPLGGGGGGALGGGVGGVGGGADASFNIALCTFPSGSADPNPFSAAEKDDQRRRKKEGEKKNAAVAEEKKKKELADKKAALQAQANLTGKSATAAGAGDGSGSATAASAPSLGVASLRIKSKAGSSKKKDKSANMFGSSLDGISATGGADGAGEDGSSSTADNTPRVASLSTDYELVCQTSHSGDLYRPARLMHLFVPEVAPDRSYFIVPSTAVPGLEGEFEVRVFGASTDTELRLDPCVLNQAGDAIDMSGLASRRVSNAMIAGMASHKVKPVVGGGTGKSGSTKAKKKH